MTTLLIAICISLIIVTIVATIIVFAVLRNMLIQVSESLSDMTIAITAITEQLKELGITE